MSLYLQMPSPQSNGIEQLNVIITEDFKQTINSAG
jgi:hypothetical protein